MKILVCDRLAPSAVKVLRDKGHEVHEAEGLKGADLIAALDGCRGLIVRGATKVTAEVLRGARDLRVVARAGTGVDNIDVAVAKELGIEVRNAPAANAISVAELTFALMLAFERHVAPASADLRDGRWEKSKYTGRELFGRALGLMGFGRIGRDVATRARAFGMTVAAYDPLVSSWPIEYAWVRRLDRLEDLLPQVDYLSLHVPLTGETKGRIGERELSAMRKEAVLVNCARGGVVDETALHAALTSGRLRGALVDVFAVEPAPSDHPLLRLPNVLATPHLGAATHEAQDRAGVEAAEQVIAILERLPV
jgi:D-3-phosphoglycerate dehydrogenase